MNITSSRLGMTFAVALCMMLGGMLFTVEAQAQSTAATYTVPAPAGSSWVNPTQAQQSVQAEILQLTAELDQLIQGNADEQAIGKKKTELLFYLQIQQHLNAGFHVSWSIEEAFRIAGGEAVADAGGQHPFMSLSDLQGMRDEAITKLTI